MLRLPVRGINQALLDINGDGSISFDEMMAVAKECLAAERAAAASGGARDPTVKAALDRFQAYLVQYSVRGLGWHQPPAVNLTRGLAWRMSVNAAYITTSAVVVRNVGSVPNAETLLRRQLVACLGSGPLSPADRCRAAF